MTATEIDKAIEETEYVRQGVPVGEQALRDWERRKRALAALRRLQKA